MKNITICIMLFTCISSFSQPVSINTTTYTPAELVNNVLINSPCVAATNITFRTGSNFGSANGIAYFTNTNPQFPFSKGVVMTTGNAIKVPAPNNTILSDGTPSWPGDADLEANLLSASGITINSINASVLEFDFTPKTPNFDFSFLFASEEYGAFQCNFSDAFAFLLTDLTTGITTNIAVIPSTNIPISVETIRNNNYNDDCPSANPAYFGSYNGPGSGPAINFNGQTVEMIATATVLTTHQYHIKLVIADGGNNTDYDSAIFLKADSFNIGQNVLGPDITVENGTAVCPGGTLPVLSAAGLSTGTTFQWKQGTAIIPGQTNPTLDLNTALPTPFVSGQATFSVTYTEPGCSPVTDQILVEYYPAIGALPTVPDIYTCDTGAASYNFDLTKNTTIILTRNTLGNTDDLPPTTPITYYLTSAQAASGNPADQLPVHYTVSATTTIYVRIQSTTTPCYEIRSFNLEIVPAPVIAAVPPDITLCGRSATETPALAIVNVNDAIAIALGIQDTSYNIVSFHSSQAGADNNTNTITPNAGNILTGTATLFMRIQNITNSGCYVTTSFQVTVTPKPEVDIFPDVVVCFSYTLPILTKPGAQYWSDPNGTGTQYFSGDLINSDTTLYVYNSTGSCSTEDSFSITVSNLPDIEPKSESHCTQYILPYIPYGKYYTGPNATGTELPIGFVVTETSTLHLHFVDTTVTPNCHQDEVFTITIIPFTELPDYPNQFGCVSYTLPADSNGGTYYAGPDKTGGIITPGTIITTTTPIYVYKESATTPLNCISEKIFTVYIGINSISPPQNIDSCSSYTLPALTVGEYWSGPSGTGIHYLAGDVINETSTLYFHVQGESCTDNLPFTITVNIPPLPPFPNVGPVCVQYLLPAVAHSGNYFTGPLGTGKLLAVGSAVTATQTIYFYDKAPTGPCYVQEDFIVTINPAPPIDPRPIEVFKCNEPYILNDLVNGEYYAFPGGPSPTNPILPPGTVIAVSKTIYVFAQAAAPNTCTQEYSIEILITDTHITPVANPFACDSYTLPAITGNGSYYTISGGPSVSGNVQKFAGDTITATTTLYIYAENNGRFFCSDERPFTITITPTPIFTAAEIADVNTCNSYTLPPLTTPNANYYDSPGGTIIPAGTVLTNSQTIYAYAVNGTAPNTCSTTEDIIITIYKVDDFPDRFACIFYILPSLTTTGAAYYTAPNGGGTMLPQGSTITSSQTVYIYGTPPFSTSCSSQTDFYVTINQLPTASTIPDSMITVCDDDGANDGAADFDLDSLTAVVLGSQDPAVYAVAYFDSVAEIASGVPIPTDGSTGTDTNTSVFFIKIFNKITPDCFVTVRVELNVIPLPESGPLTGIICIDSKTGEITAATVSSGLDPSLYTFSWSDSNNTEISTAAVLHTSEPGDYTLVVTAIGTLNSCQSAAIPVTVIESAGPAGISFTSSGWFSEHQTVTVHAVPYIGDGSNFLYSLDGNPPQTANVFTDVTSGSHEITVSDANGCGSIPLPIQIKLISSPPAFTPNGDGFNDIWKIDGLEDQAASRIFIFDRYGKLLKQLFTNGEGWDGMFNGLPMPSTDYWFNITYIENGIPKEYRSHFSLIR